MSARFDPIRLLLRWLGSKEGLAYLALIAVAVAVRVYLAPRVMVSNDIQAYEYWGELANQNVFHVYSQAELAPSWIYIPTYPPVAIYLFGLIDKVYFGLGALFGIPLLHDVTISHMLKLVIKLPGIFADAALLTIMYVKAVRVMRVWIAWLLCATYAFSPGVLITTIFWGQTDGLVLLLVVFGLIFAMRKQAIWCGVMFALAVNFKPQPIVFVPLALVYLWKWDSFRLAVRGAVAFLVVTVVVWIPYALPPFGELRAFKHNLILVETAEGLTATHDAWNLWYVLGIPQQSISTHILGPLSITDVGYGLLLVTIVIATVGVWRSKREELMWAGSGLIALAFFAVGTLQFERYLFPTLGLFFLAALFNRRYWLLYVAVTVAFMANYESALFYCSCDAYSTRVSPLWRQALMFHLDAWQTGVIVCGALIAGVAFFILTKVGGQERERSVFAPSFGLGQPIGRPAIAVSGIQQGAGVFASVVSSHADALSPASGRTEAATALLQETARRKAVTLGVTTPDDGAPKLRLHPRALTKPPYISVVIPCYNEEGNIRQMYERLSAVLRRMTPTYEIIFVNNGSYDNSPAIFDDLAARDQHVSILTLSRNFGSQGAYTAGYAYASGDCMVGLDGDIQDPPELIEQFVEKWLEGYDVVYGVRAKRKGSLPRRIGYKLFYRLLRRLSYVNIPVDASDFALMDRRVVNVLNEMPERSRLLRGLRAYAGFSQTGIAYERQERFAGETSNSFLGLFRWASLGIISFSFAPLDLISYIAGVVVVLSGVAAIIYTALYFIFPGAPRGFETILIAVLFLGAVQLLCLSIIGAYLGKIFEEVKGRPRFLVADIQNNHHETQGEAARD